MNDNERVLSIHLVRPAALPDVGVTVLGPAGVRGRLSIEEGPRVTLTLGSDWEAPIASVRWLVDQVVRRARRLIDLSGSSVELLGEVPPALRSALLLDLRRAFGARGDKGGVEVPGEDGRYARSEDTFRRWVNEDPATRTSLAIARDVLALEALTQSAGRPGRVEVEVLDEAALNKEGLNLLLAVGQASEVSPPRLCLARWLPDGADDESPTVLLGKGITFDTGGINVKPYESFVSHMRNDMAGAALAYALFSHLVAGGHPRPLVLVIPTCENAIGHNAMRPGTVVKSYRGPRVKIDHTDAEGRLILADALAYAEDRFQPERTFSFATLTTAALQSYGPHATPVHFAAAEMEALLAESAAVTGEDLHFFPARPWHFEANRDEEADLKNTARLTGYMPASAGSRNAAHFLLHFARRPLIHADIFASTWNWGGDHPGTGFGATGTPLRTFALALAR
jgi:leucyl aminopeptidase